jgi:hypothetical protein
MCYIYIGTEEGKTLNYDVWIGGKPSEGGGGTLGGPREGVVHYPMWARLYIRKRQPNSLYKPKPNTT